MRADQLAEAHRLAGELRGAAVVFSGLHPETDSIRMQLGNPISNLLHRCASMLRDLAMENATLGRARGKPRRRAK